MKIPTFEDVGPGEAYADTSNAPYEFGEWAERLPSAVWLILAEMEKERDGPGQIGRTKELLKISAMAEDLIEEHGGGRHFWYFVVTRYTPLGGT